MGAKAYLLMLAALASAGCADGLKRFAPPGIVKYEDRAKGQPVSPEIAERILEAEAAKGGGFPKLSEQPTKAPEGIARPERAAMEETLLVDRDRLNDAVALDRAAAVAERADSIEAAADALAEAIEKDDAAARRERGLPPREPKPQQD